MIVGADASSDATILARRRRCTRRTACAASTTPRSARSRARPRGCRRRRRRSCASIGCTRPTGCCATTASARREITTRRAPACSTSTIDPEARVGAGAPRAHFPVDVNTAPREMLLRVPGPRRAQRRSASSPRGGSARCASPISRKLRCDIAKARHFVVAGGLAPRARSISPTCEARLLARQLALTMKSPYESWRDKARAIARRRRSPGACATGRTRCCATRLPDDVARTRGATLPRVPASLVDLLKRAACHRDPAPQRAHVPAAVARRARRTRHPARCGGRRRDRRDAPRQGRRPREPQDEGVRALSRAARRTSACATSRGSSPSTTS